MTATRQIDSLNQQPYSFFGYVGESTSIKFTFTDTSGAVDLTGETISFVAKRFANDTDYLISATNGGTGEDLANGIVVFDIDLTEADLVSLVDGCVSYDLVSQATTGTNAVLSYDNFTVKPNLI